MSAAKKSLEDLTAEQEALLEPVAQEYLALLQPGPAEIDMTAVRAWLAIVYGLHDLKLPERIEVVDSPHAALLLATDLTGEVQSSLDWVGVSDAGWVSFYDYFRRIGVLTEEESAETMALSRFMTQAWDMAALDECAIVVRRPDAIRVDDQGRLHCSDGPCIIWRDGEKDYSWHGVWVDERIIMSPRSYTREEYIAITNVEQRRALGESAGWGHIVELLGARELDSWRDPQTGLGYALFGTERERWLRKQSPRIKTHEQPFYFEPVHEDLKTAQAARKWQAARDWTPADCERDPVLTYGVET